MQDRRKVAIEKLTGTIEPVTEEETSGLTNSPFDNRGQKFILRKGLTVENYYKQVLNKLLEGLKVDLTKDLGQVTTLGEKIVPEGATDFNRIKSISSILNDTNIKPKVQEGGQTDDDASTKTWTSTLVSNKGNPLFQKGTNEKVEGKDNIQKLLNKCQDLEALYAIKHYEFMEILKPITYFLDTLSKNMVLYIIILHLYGNAEKIGKITLEGSNAVIDRAADVITNITTFIKQQKDIIGSIKDITQTSSNGKDNAETISKIEEAKTPAQPETTPVQPETTPVADPAGGEPEPETTPVAEGGEAGADPAEGEGEGRRRRRRGEGEGEGEEADRGPMQTLLIIILVQQNFIQKKKHHQIQTQNLERT